MIAQRDLARATMQLCLVQDMVDGVVQTSLPRAEELIGLIRAMPLGERATAYMQRATRCFLAGLDEECIIMCGSVMEAAYADRFDDLLMMEHNKGRKQKNGEWVFGAKEYELVATLSGTLSTESAKLAERLRESRNDLIHNTHKSDMKAYEALEICATLLDQLFPADPLPPHEP
jgi:hypothetical protein